MASFDPQVQSQGDNPFIYGFGARPAQQSKPDVSGEAMGKTIGKGLGEAGNLVKQGSELAFNVTKDNIDTQLHQQYDKSTNDYINRLSQVDDVLNKHPDTLDMASKNYPSDIQKLPGMVDQLVALRDNGKVSSTYLDMQRDSIAKGMRAKYPGMRDVIDQEFSRMTREDPANKVMSQLTEDINAHAAASRAKKDAVGTALLGGVKQGLIDPSVYFGQQQGKISPQVALNSLYAQAKTRADLRLDDLKMSNEIKHNQINKEKASQMNADWLGKNTAAAFDKLHVQIPGFQSDKVGDVINYINSGNDPNVEQDARALATVIAGARASYVANATAEGNKPFDPNNPTSLSRSSVQGAEDFQKSVIASAKPFDEVLTALSNKDYGSAYATINHWHAMIDEEGQRLLDKDPNIGIAGAVNKIAPNYVGKLITNLIPDVGLSDEQRAYVLQTQGKAVAPTPGMKASGLDFNLGKAMDDAVQKGASGPRYSSANAAIISGIQKVLTDPDAPQSLKENAANFLYGDPDAVQKFKASEVNKQGAVLPGRSTVTANLVNAQNTQAVKKLSDPDTTMKYIAFAKKSVAHTITPEIEQLNQLKSDPDYTFHWDADKNNFFYTINPKNAGINPGARIRHPDYQNQVDSSMKKINLALRSLIDVNSKLTHEKVTDFLAQFFVESGMNPELIKGTIGGQLIEALISSQQAGQSEALKKAKNP